MEAASVQVGDPALDECGAVPVVTVVTVVTIVVGAQHSGTGGTIGAKEEGDSVGGP
jgi:hypothetical protein